MATATTMHTEEVALFSDPPYNTAEDKVSWIEHRPTFISQGGVSSIHFHIAGNSTQYIDLGRSELYVRLSIEKEKGDFSQTELALPIDMILHTMWASVDISLNNTQVSTSGTEYPYKAALECLLNNSKNTKEFQLAQIGMTPDTANFDSCIPNENKGGVNAGLILRQDLWGPNLKAEFSGPLLADICNQDRLLLDNVDVDITLYPSKNPFRLLTAPVPQTAEDKIVEAKLIIEDIYMNVCKVEVNKYCMSGHEAGLEIAKCKYPMQKTVMLTKILPAGSFGDKFEDLFQGLVPSKMVVGMVDAEAYSGHFNKNPLRFQHFDIESLGFYVNGVSTPKEPFRFNIPNNQFLEGLTSLYKLVGKTGQDTDIGITRSMWKAGLALVGFDVDPTTSADFKYLGIPKEGHTKIELKLRGPSPGPIALIIYAQFPARVEIDRQRNVAIKGAKELSNELLRATQSKPAVPSTAAAA